MSLMLKEIEQQPEVLARTLKEETAKILKFGKFLSSREIHLIVLVARGSSDNAALFGRYLLEITNGIPVSLAASSVHTLYHSRLRMNHTLVVGVSQSGEGTDINWVLRNSKKQGAYTIGITNEGRSSMSKLVDEVFLIRAGKERSVAATKTYTGQLLMFYLLAAALQGGRGVEKLQRIPELAAASLRLKTQVASMVERYRFMNHCIVVGRGLNYANAYELAIKLMETCYIVSERFSSADFLHGPVAMVQQDFPVILFAPPGKTFKDMRKLARQLKGLKAETVVISSEPSVLKWATRSVKVGPRIEDFISPIPYIIPGQLFAAMLAEVKGLSPDKPRLLKKVTQTL
ncbi:MAG: glutamine--fructose-6-phosphate aminotransferase [Acidobacteria bacterium]|nr:MAG: glutamine--fructose-6-phosphate aminotransferase [Acidobacteriota bacterium]